ncbi:MAG: clan AA aspartic protease [Thermoanaerobaculia bacterium]|nr:clan AA aspartic protease [Thermoanaerobaculia bacterium]
MLQVKEKIPEYKTATSKSWVEMGRVYAEIELIPTRDLILAAEGHLEESQVRKSIVRFVVDSGADYLCINEHIKNQLQLTVLEERVFELADGTEVRFEIAGPVDIRFGNRQATCRAVVLPGDTDPLLGAIPMEDLDVVIHPRSQTLTVNPENPFTAKHYLK